MNDLIEALTIFAKYTSHSHPTCCEHDVMYVLVDPQAMSLEDIERVTQLSFEPGDTNFYSNRFGSA